MKKFMITAGLILFIFIFMFPPDVNALQTDFEEIYGGQADSCNLQKIFDALPQETKSKLYEMGITSINYGELSDLDTKKLLEQFSQTLTLKSKTPFCQMAVCIGIMMLCSLTEGFNITVSDRKLNSVLTALGTVCICTAIIVPVCATVSRASEVLNGVSGFMVLYLPIMAGLVISSGNQALGTSYYTLMMTAGNVISSVSSKLIMPLMNVFLALSVTSSLSPKMNLSSLCECVYKTAKWILTLSMSVFTAVLSLQAVITSSMDNVSKKTLKFALGSFVPVVGGVLGEALTTFTGSLELLKSGAGVFVIIASAVIVMPVVTECIIWQFSLFVLSSAGEIMGLSAMTKIFKTVSKAIGILNALLICVLTVFIISTGIILLVGR